MVSRSALMKDACEQSNCGSNEHVQSSSGRDLTFRLVSVMYSFIYLLYASYFSLIIVFWWRIPFVFGKQYGWDQQKAGLSYLGMAIGSLAGLSVVYFGSDRISQSLTKKHGVKSPEVRPSFSDLIIVPSRSLLLVAVFDAHWINDLWLVCPRKGPLVGRLINDLLISRIIPISGTFIFGFGTAIIFVKSHLTSN